MNNTQVKTENTDILNAGQFLTLARVVGLGAAFNVALALCLGSYDDIVNSAGPANFLLPFVIAIVVAGGLAAGWHVVLGMAAHAISTHAKIIAFTIGFGLAVIGTATSAWFLAAKIGGVPAIQTHQSKYLNSLQAASQLVAENSAVETEIVLALENGATRLTDAAQSEGKFGTFSGTAGFKGVFDTLNNTAKSLLATRIDLKKRALKRNRLLSGARSQIEEAGRALSQHDGNMFEVSANRAASLIAEANRIRLSVLTTGLDIGSNTGAAGQEINSVTGNIASTSQEVESRQRLVSIPVFVPMDAKTAIVTYPAALPWIMAILIEGLPLIMLGLLIALPRAGGSGPSTHSYKAHSNRRRQRSLGHGQHGGKE